MNITGIVAEYNPLHNGHIYHLLQTKKICSSDGIVCVMSGNFVQRGEPALIDKWNRTKAAILSGVDLVVELPCIYSLSSAEFFAFGAVSLLNSLEVVNSLCFGSESGNIKNIELIAAILNKEPEEYKNFLKDNLKQGLSFPKARMKAIKEFFLKNLDFSLDENDMTYSNNVLGIEYCKSLKKLNSTIKPYTVKRKGNLYTDTKLSDYPSATAIRNHLKKSNNIDLLKDLVPKSSFSIIKSNVDNITFKDSMFNFLKYKTYINKDSLKNLPDVSEGLENKIYNALVNSNSIDEALTLMKSKRYAYTRLTRILSQYYIGFDCYNTEHLRKLPCPYARILGFNKRGKEILRLMKSKSKIPLISKVNRIEDEILNLDMQATRAYSLINNSINPLDDYLKKPIIF
ncbi:nucleotidyltransferase [Clostridium guangxiense]|uniref:nucleotidyltransferase n=1 Tax=Clostridium guangxiense TaxID=1662055 RepID=UPI001E4FFE01|nr:nucleotidyltransferase [Clostridium guangxiense]MCD2346008.1 nucleotidyltransferase [Clostridium guangxiense]